MICFRKGLRHENLFVFPCCLDVKSISVSIPYLLFSTPNIASYILSFCQFITRVFFIVIPTALCYPFLTSSCPCSILEKFASFPQATIVYWQSSTGKYSTLHLQLFKPNFVMVNTLYWERPYIMNKIIISV